MKQESSEVLAAPVTDNALVTMGFSNMASFEFMQRTAKMFAASTMVPAAYQSMITKGFGDRATVEPNSAALSNCVIALDMSQRMNANPLMIMQNLHIIEGRPSWSSQFIIAAINNCGKFSPLRFDLEWLDEIDATFSTFEWVNKQKVEKKQTIRIKDARCVAWAIEKATGERLESAPVTMDMSVAEGWFGKNGSKWKSMPDLMMRYRSAAFFGRIYAPELLMGLPAAEEVHDIIDVDRQPDGTYAANDLIQESAIHKIAPRAPKAKVKEAATDATNVKDVPEAAANEAVDMETGEVTQPASQNSQGDDSQASLVDDEGSAQEPKKEPASPPLSDAKIQFVKDKMVAGALSDSDMRKKFGVLPSELCDSHFPAVLAWLKDPAA